MLTVAKGRIVRIEFEIRVKGGDVVESSAKEGPLTYTHGEGRMLPGLEKRLDGMSVGEERTGEISAAEAFGGKDALPTKKMPKKEFPAGATLAAGEAFEAKGPHGEALGFEIVSVEADTVTVRLVPPLFGKDLAYRVKVLLVDDPVMKQRQGVAPPPPPADAMDLSADELKEV